MHVYHKTCNSHSNKHQWSEHFNNATALIQNKWDNFINGDKRNSTMTGIPFNKLTEIHAANIHMMSSASELLEHPSCPTDVKKKKSFEILYKFYSGGKIMLQPSLLNENETHKLSWPCSDLHRGRRSFLKTINTFQYFGFWKIPSPCWSCPQTE